MNTLEQQREQMKSRRFLAMPLAGTLVWSLLAITGSMLPMQQAVMAIWIGTGSIFYLGMFFSKLTGENFMAKGKPKNEFDRLFFCGVIMCLLIFAIAMPVAMIDPTTVPLTVAILSGLMWLPLSWIIQHWIGYFHGVARTLLVVAAWMLFPEHRFVLIPLIVVAIYVVSIVALEIRYRKVNGIGRYAKPAAV